MRVAAQIDVSAPREVVWDWITDPTRQLHFLSGVTRWEVSGDLQRGCGARYRMLMRVGSAEVGGVVEVVEFDEPGDMAWTSVTGLDQRGRWRLRETASPARACSAGSPSASRRPRSPGICAGRCSSSSARSSTTSCAARRPSGAGRARQPDGATRSTRARGSDRPL
ncbi:MAG: SRPBCC family protein [Actinobacteria bacterium]|nr:MAG: SRPBCC family protein [Actinomycetota bacterium]